ncbi:ParA family protein [Lujinxingia sediminis]|uniref:ParA family protein n=1 Tax=Lujinxingia sediminis TaxID=2480984 RepID=A0ABY0CXG6_9DELT|nr:AAA family ATPase [Lujinxingia sediminis]RVU48389.1 ParA family protein [Lujinxingia sediminis]
MKKIVAIANQKGGVGKTTTSVNLAACLAAESCRVLLIDLDPQGNATSGVGVDREECDTSIYDALVGLRSVETLIRSTQTENLDLIPSTTDLAGAQIELVSADDREFRLRQALEKVPDDYDFVILDCPPSLGLLTINALAAANTVLVPIQTEYYALEGLGHLLRTIELIHEHLNPALTIEGILLTMYDSRTNLSEQVATEVSTHFGELVFQTVIPRNVRLGEAPSFGMPISEYDRSSRGAISYRDFAREFLKRNGHGGVSASA